MSSQTSLIGEWSGLLNKNGSTVDLGFDSSKGQLFQFKLQIGGDKVNEFTITDVCEQSKRIILTPWFSVKLDKTYSLGISLNGRTLTIVTMNDDEPVSIIRVRCYALTGYVTDRVGPAGPQGPKGEGVEKDSEVGEAQDDMDVVNKEYLEEQFLPAMMTRRVFSKGVSMQGGRIEGLPEPQALADAVTKSYADGKISELRRYVDTEDGKLMTKIANGDMFLSVQTKNMLDLKSGDFSSGPEDFNVFIFGEERDYTRKYHNSRSHVVSSLQRDSGRLIVNLGELKPGKYGVRVEAITDPKDDSRRFDMNVNTVNTDLIVMRTRYKDKIDPHAVVVDLELEVRVDMKNLNTAIEIDHMANKEIALFIFGRRGEGHVDPQIVDNIDYHDKIKIPAYPSFGKMDRRPQIGISDTFESEYPNHPFKNLLADFNHFQRNSNGAFRFDKACDGHGSIRLYFPCLVSLSSIIFTQKTESSHGQYMIRCFDEKAGHFVDLVGRSGFSWSGKSLDIALYDNVARLYEISLIRGKTTPNVDILPLKFETRTAYF